MEDGPEFAEGSYEFAGKTYRLAEVDSQVWRVYDGETYLGIVTETDPTPAERWPHYTAQSAGDEARVVPTTDDWRAALDHLIEAADVSNR
ncbi:hypothetical protein K2F54_17875 [Cryobacterium sp. 1639]|uniref:hypothetical protein n=1 Tax=Cryobacterium inferilacus TaxID=2866629 RepID=UPI001C73AC0D|nr:hypothetical protein [Cryobacterium sp. 1639]MBX0301836.1 hypothetical protein [Cryobacterium sp. 1639]